MAIHLFNEEYSIKRGEKTTENQAKDEQEGFGQGCFLVLYAYNVIG